MTLSIFRKDKKTEETIHFIKKILAETRLIVIEEPLIKAINA